jgi:hypothetical protein
MSILDIFRVGQIKHALATVTGERDSLQALLKNIGALELHEVRQRIGAAEQLHESLVEKAESVAAHHAKLSEDLVVLEDKLLLQSFGLYEPLYALRNSDEYRDRLDEIRAKQAAMVKAGEAAHCPTGWQVNNSKKEGERMIRDYSKLIVRAFNNECDAATTAVKFNNIASVEKRIQKAFDTLNKLGNRMSISIVAAYLSLKLEELHLCYEYQLRKQEEKEEQKRIREQLREEARLQKEIEEARAMLTKEEMHFKKALITIDARLEAASTESERDVLLEEKRLISSKLEEVMKKERDIDYRQQNTRAGYVYIISNVGAFGEGVFKIGVTRRLDPVERVDELSDASVPYDFDIHAIIFSEDAPKLENSLHKHFSATRLNLVNLRREFFRASLDDIETVVRNNFKKPIEITRLAEAAQFRQSEKMRVLADVGSAEPVLQKGIVV